MDTTSLIEIVLVIIVIYLFIKFIVSPIIKAIVGIIIFLVAIYLLQQFFGFDLSKVLAPFGITFNSSNWGSSFNWFTGPVSYWGNELKTFVNFISGNFPKTTKP